MKLLGRLFRRRREAIRPVGGEPPGEPSLRYRYGSAGASPSLLTDHPQVPATVHDHLSAYGSHAWVYACVYTIATSAASVPVRVMRQLSTDRKRIIGCPDQGASINPFIRSTSVDSPVEEVADHPLARLLANPNPEFSAFDLFESTFSFLELTGNAYWLLQRNALGFPVRIDVLRPDRVRITNRVGVWANGGMGEVNSPTRPNSHTPTRRYEYAVDSRTYVFEDRDVLHFRYFHPLSDHYGLGPLSAAERSAVIDLYAQAHDRVLFERAGLPVSVVLQPESGKAFSPQQSDTLKTELHRLFQQKGPERMAVLPMALNSTPLGAPVKSQEQRKMAREEILASFGVPPVLIGILDHASYANAREQKLTFWSETMRPKIEKVNAALNAKLAPQFESNHLTPVPSPKRRGELMRSPSLQIIHDLTGILSLLEDEQKNAQVDDMLVRAGILTINEARAKRRLPPVAGGDVTLVPRTSHLLSSLTYRQ